MHSLDYLCRKVEWIEAEENVLCKYINSLKIPILKLSSNSNNYDTKINVLEGAFSLTRCWGEHSALDVKDQIIEIFKILSDMLQKTLEEKIFLI